MTLRAKKVNRSRKRLRDNLETISALCNKMIDRMDAEDATKSASACGDEYVATLFKDTMVDFKVPWYIRWPAYLSVKVLRKLPQ